MAASNTSCTSTLVLLGLVVAAHFCVAAEASARSYPADQYPTTTGGHGGQGGARVEVVLGLKVNLGKCRSAVSVLVHGAVAAVGGAKVKAVECRGGVVTVLHPVVLNLRLGHLVAAVDVVVGGPHGVVVKVLLDLTKVATVVDGVYYAALDVVEDVERKTLSILSLGVYLRTVSLLNLGVFLGVHL